MPWSRSVLATNTLKDRQQVSAFPRGLPAPTGKNGSAVVHVHQDDRQTINRGIDFTFGYFRRVREPLEERSANFLARTRREGPEVFLVEKMGRSADGGLTAPPSAAQASLVLSVEDLSGTERHDARKTVQGPQNGAETTRQDFMKHLRKFVDHDWSPR